MRSSLSPFGEKTHYYNGTYVQMKHCLIIFTVILVIAHCAEANENPVEVGSVRWGRDLDGALKISAETGRPVLVLFQEVPGCIGCQDFGKTVLTNPLLVEAIEEEFLPVLVYNNRGGEDKKLLNRFSEPAWNYQVIRFLNAKGRDIIPRKDRIWTISGIAIRMIEVLKASKRQVPKYLETVAIENNTKNHGVSAFAMHCFWAGEVNLGRIEGVVTTDAGWIENHEVARTVYNKEKITLRALARKARDAKSALKVYTPDNEANGLKDLSTGQLDGRYHKAKASDQKKNIEGWQALKEVPGLTKMQKTKINAFISAGRAKALDWLSPRQRQALRKAERNTSADTDKPHR